MYIYIYIYTYIYIYVHIGSIWEMVFNILYIYMYVYIYIYTVHIPQDFPTPDLPNPLLPDHLLLRGDHCRGVENFQPLWILVVRTGELSTGVLSTKKIGDFMVV